MIPAPGTKQVKGGYSNVAAFSFFSAPSCITLWSGNKAAASMRIRALLRALNFSYFPALTAFSD